MTVMFARPADLALPLLTLAEQIWASPDLETLRQVDDWDLLLATLLGLDADEDTYHDELTRCQSEGCGAWFWAEDGGTLQYESGADITVCAEHFVNDDPGMHCYPGVGLLAVLEDADRRVDAAYYCRNGA